MGEDPPPHRRARRRRMSGAVVLLVAAFYVVPVAEPVAEPGTLLRAGGTAVLLGAGVWFIAREVVREARVAGGGAPAERVQVDRLVLALVLGVLVFALADFVVATSGDGQFVGLQTRTDALYFSLATLCTVGFGDVHAAGQLARALVSLQMVFDVAVLASAIQVIGRGLRGDGGSR
ncbi:potassium channel family protein [Modestobacter sp. SSW1-42]|uniref:potassium channel family protein n=1 Tax=Modestobacter sp. SSW1-42 TaxID=596372 RepID=UPI003985955F